MNFLEERIAKDGIVKEGNVLKVDSFLNHQMDIDLIDKIGEEFYREFKDQGITKILTVEASGIGIACLTARYFNVPMVFAKKTASANQSQDLYTAKVHSFTRGTDYIVRVDKKYLVKGDRVLIIDDFLANGAALMGLLSIVEEAGAVTVGAGICVEKAFQPGGDLIRSKGVKVHSLAIVDLDENGEAIFIKK